MKKVATVKFVVTFVFLFYLIIDAYKGNICILMVQFVELTEKKKLTIPEFLLES